MVLPMNGPHVKSGSGLGPTTSLGFKPQWQEWERRWWRQRRPYTVPANFQYQRRDVLSFSSDVSGAEYVTVSNCTGYQTISPSTFQPGLFNKAHAKLISRLKPDTAGLGIGLVQRTQALSMIESRALQLARFSRNIRKFRFKDAARDLGLSPSVVKTLNLRKKAKAFGNNFLEFHFGWSPLIGDIYSSVDLLQSGVPPQSVTSSATWSPEVYFEETSSSPKRYRTSKRKYAWRLGCKVHVSNPNLFLANQLGLVNPAVIVYDAIPFSFVLNWFVNVEQFLNSFTDTWGLTITDQYYTGFFRDDSSEIQTIQWPTPSLTSTLKRFQTRTVNLLRLTGSIPGPSLRVRGPWTFSPTRGLTAVSLLVQRLR